jgi:hypothetical protein
MLEKDNFYKEVPPHHVYITIHDAVHHAQDDQLEALTNRRNNAQDNELATNEQVTFIVDNDVDSCPSKSPISLARFSDDSQSFLSDSIVTAPSSTTGSAGDDSLIEGNGGGGGKEVRFEQDLKDEKLPGGQKFKATDSPEKKP